MNYLSGSRVMKRGVLRQFRRFQPIEGPNCLSSTDASGSQSRCASRNLVLRELASLRQPWFSGPSCSPLLIAVSGAWASCVLGHRPAGSRSFPSPSFLLD